MEARKIQMGRRFQPAASFAFALSVSAVLAAQVRVDVRLVNVIVTVTDSRGRYIPNLTENDFIVEEDGKIQHISHFSQDQNVPVSVGILLNTDGQDTASVSRLDDVLERIRISDLVIYPIGISPLTYAKGSDRNAWGLPLPGLIKGKTGIQNKRDQVDMSVLRAFAENSGGRAFLLAETLIGRGGQIEKILNVIAEELRSQYTLGYYPPRADDGQYHSIRIRTRAGDAVRARHGYLARSS